MQTISNVATLADYDATLTLGPDDFDGITVSVWNNSVVMQVYSAPGGRWQQGTWESEQLIAPSTVSLDKCAGVRFKTNPASGLPGRIVASARRVGEPLIAGGVQLTGTLAGTGTITPAATTVNVQHNNVLVGAEPTLDYLDGAEVVYTVVDDGANTRVQVTPTIAAGGIGRPKLAQAWGGGAVRVNSDFGVAQNTVTAIVFDTVAFNNGATFVNIGANPTRVTMPVTGLYAVAGVCQWTNDGNGQRRAYIRINGGSAPWMVNDVTPGGGIPAIQNVGGPYFFNAGDYIELVVFHDSASISVTNTILHGNLVNALLTACLL